MLTSQALRKITSGLPVIRPELRIDRQKGVLPTAADVLLHVMTCVDVRSCSTSCLFRQDHDVLSPASYCTVMLTVAMLLARFGSGVSAMVAAFSVITVPDGAVTFTVRRTVHVVFGAMALFSWQTICPVP
jgi:hypothetical protein